MEVTIAAVAVDGRGDVEFFQQALNLDEELRKIFFFFFYFFNVLFYFLIGILKL